MTKQTTTDIIKALDGEIDRAKKFANSNGGNNASAIGLIVRQYRQSLKEFRKIVADDRADGVETYD
jgi:hypothetical protein